MSVLCVHETRWKGNKAKELDVGCKLFYSGANNYRRNGVGIVLSEDLKANIQRTSDSNEHENEPGRGNGKHRECLCPPSGLC